LYKSTFKNKQKSNVINHKPETHAVAYIFKDGSWQILMC